MGSTLARKADLRNDTESLPTSLPRSAPYCVRNFPNAFVGYQLEPLMASSAFIISLPTPMLHDNVHICLIMPLATVVGCLGGWVVGFKLVGLGKSFWRFGPK